MKDGLLHAQQALKGLEQQLSCLVKDVNDLKREEEAYYEQSNRRHLGVPRNDVRNGGNYVNIRGQYWWDYKCENGRRMGAQLIKTWSLVKQSLRNKFGLKTMKDKYKVKQTENS
ncbi:hypothetical protein M9H77_35973 [Catharanthus roseus]|uniref:Uncharacterized protein n=1 Tax=Catharanthus roseus TaxID=4058 RepID=A0ACB9ZQV3_CATRO|nr:hypothetical protein M9H77_35973 [Catharanthus roseus]